MENPINIFLCERIPSENRGEAAILEGMVEGLKQTFGKFSLTIYSMRLKQDHEYYGEFGTVIGFDYSEGVTPSLVDRFKRYAFSIKLLLNGLVKKYLNHNLVFSDELFSAFSTANIIFQGHDNVYRNKIKLKDALVVFYAKQHEKKVMIPGASIGPFKTMSFFHKKIVTYVLTNSDLITLRDKQSEKYVKSIGITRKCYSLTDIAFLLKPSEVAIPWEMKDMVIGFTPTEYVFQELTGVNQHETSIEYVTNEVCNYLIWLSKEFNAKIILIPHVYGPEKKQDDRLLTDKIFQRCKEMDQKADFHNLNEREYKASELKYLFGQLDLLIGCRTHTIIGALGMLTPVIAFTDPHRYKTNGIVGDLFELEQCLYNVQTWDINVLKKITRTIIKDYTKITNSIESKLPRTKQLALENFLLLKKVIIENNLNQ